MTPEPSETLVEQLADAIISEETDRALAYVVELAERVKQAEEAWQRAEHPFDKAEFDAMAERVKAAEREVALRPIRLAEKLKATEAALKAAEREAAIFYQETQRAIQLRDMRAEAAERERDIAQEARRYIRGQRDELVEALEAICEIGETRDVEVARAALAKVRGEAACVCGEINTRHCPVHGQVRGEAEPPRDSGVTQAGRRLADGPAPSWRSGLWRQRQ